MNKYRDQVEKMTMDERRARLAELRERSARGDFEWEYDESLALCAAIPEEAEADRKALERNRKTAARRRRSR